MTASNHKISQIVAEKVRLSDSRSMINPSFSHGFDPKLFLSTFALIFVAELPDKTAFATLLLATRRQPWAIFMGVAAAFVVQSLIAVTFGSLLALLPSSVVKVGAAGLFFAFAISIWVRRELEEEEAAIASEDRKTFWKTVGTSFVVIFIAEWGDLTQLATAALEAKFKAPLTIFLSAILALWAVTGIAIVVGHKLRKMIDPDWLQKGASIAFLIVGIILLIGAGRS